MCILRVELRYFNEGIFLKKTKTEAILKFPCKFKHRHQCGIPSTSIQWIQKSVVRPDMTSTVSRSLQAFLVERPTKLK